MGNSMSGKYAQVEIPKSKRMWNVVAMLSASLIPAVVFGLIVYETQGPWWGYLAMATYVLIGLLASYRIWTTEHERVLTEEAQQELAAAQREEVQRANEFYEKWWVRYAFAIAFVLGGVWLYSQNVQWWWLAICAVIALVFARELLKPVLYVVGVIALIFLFFVVRDSVIPAIGKMPTSVAIIIGAIIIAAAVGSNKR
jgi:Ca2+/Na+ antiporter